MARGRRKLTPEELAIADRAKSLWVSKKKAEKLSQSDAADSLGMSSSAFNQYINGVIPFNTDATLKFSKYFGVKPSVLNSEWLEEAETPGIKESTNDTYFESLLEVIDDDQAIEEIRAVLSRISPKGALTVARLFLDRAEDGL